MARRASSGKGYRYALAGSKAVIRLLFYVLLLVILLFLGRVAYDYGYQMFAAPAEATAE